MSRSRSRRLRDAAIIAIQRLETIETELSEAIGASRSPAQKLKLTRSRNEIGAIKNALACALDNGSTGVIVQLLKAGAASLAFVAAMVQGVGAIDDAHRELTEIVEHFKGDNPTLTPGSPVAESNTQLRSLSDEQVKRIVAIVAAETGSSVLEVTAADPNESLRSQIGSAREMGLDYILVMERVEDVFGIKIPDDFGRNFSLNELLSTIAAGRARRQSGESQSDIPSEVREFWERNMAAPIDSFDDWSEREDAVQDAIDKAMTGQLPGETSPVDIAALEELREEMAFRDIKGWAAF
jgi:hypothetical protein